MKSVILALFLAANANAGNLSISGPFGGLNNTDSSITLDIGEAQDTLNVEVSQDALALKKRKGYSLLSALTVATSPITGSIAFKTASGDNIKLFGYDTKVVKSVNGGAFTDIYTTAPVNSHWSFCASNGKAYAFNSSTYSFTPFSYDGSALTYYPSMPKASLCATTVDRMLLAGTTDYPNRLYFSRSGTLTDFVVDINPEDPGFEDIGLPGEKITNIFTAQAEWLIFKTNSFTSYQGSNQFDLVPSVISEKVGMIEPRAIVQHEGIVYFKSSDGKFYGYTSGTLTEISRKIQGIVTGITRDNVNSANYSEKTEFETGIFNNTTSSETVGSVEPLAFSGIDTLNSDFEQGVYVSSVIITDGSLSINNFTSGSFLNIGAESSSTLNWTQISGNAADWTTNSANPKYGAISYEFWPNSSFVSLKSQFKVFDLNGGVIWESESSGGVVYSVNMATFTAQFVQLQYGCVESANPTSSTTIRSIAFLKSTGTLSAYSATVTNPGGTKFGCRFDIPEPVTFTSATYTSRVISVPHPSYAKGYFSAVSTAPAYGAYNTSIDYFVKSSSDAGGPFTDWAATTTYYLLSPTTNQYWMYKANLYNISSYLKPTIYSVGLVFKTTGYWETPETDMGAMSAWGLFNASSSLDPAASLTYKIAVATYSGGTANATFESLTPGSLITASTGTYSKIRATNNFTTATETVRMDSLSYSWTRSPDKLANAFEYKGDIYFGVPYLNSLTNNRLLKFDTKTAGWNIFDIAENAPLSIDEYVYFGSPTSGNIYQYPVGDSDNGAAINSYWKSKNFIGTNPYVEKQFDRISVISGSDYGSSLDVTYTMDTATSTTYTIGLTSTTADFVRNNRALPRGERGAFFNMQIGNNAANQPWSFFGASVDYTDESWIPTEE